MIRLGCLALVVLTLFVCVAAIQLLPWYVSPLVIVGWFFLLLWSLPKLALYAGKHWIKRKASEAFATQTRVMEKAEVDVHDVRWVDRVPDSDEFATGFLRLELTVRPNTDGDTPVSAAGFSLVHVDAPDPQAQMKEIWDTLSKGLGGERPAQTEPPRDRDPDAPIIEDAPRPKGENTDFVMEAVAVRVMETDQSGSLREVETANLDARRRTVLYFATDVRPPVQLKLRYVFHDFEVIDTPVPPPGMFDDDLDRPKILEVTVE
ncbi:MAG: hypothetical protein AAGK78_11880 [Planctomycetota bacterium]